MKFYIAGRMTGQKHYGYMEFTELRNKLVRLGHEVQTPFDATNRVWWKHFGEDYNPFQDKCDYGDPILLDCWLEDIKLVLWCDGVVVLDGWQESRGARVEVQTALLFGKKLFNQKLEPLRIKAEVSFKEE